MHATVVAGRRDSEMQPLCSTEGALKAIECHTEM